MAGVWLLLVSFLVGSIPFGYLVGRLFGRIDIRQHGSRNIGATNVSRLLGFRFGLLVLVLDLLKGLWPTLYLPQWLGLMGAGGTGLAAVSAEAPGVAGGGWTESGVNWQALAGLAAILGHMFPPALAFRGGKGVATALGVVLSLAPQATAVAGAVFVVSLLGGGYMSLASMLAALTFGLLQLWWIPPRDWSAQNAGLVLFSVLVPALIVWRHRGNISRLWQGTEPRFQFRKSVPTEPPAPPGAAHG
ncbi:MAG: glycerol-3-phosphate 1-O-acyltransferase PlsY [Planctomycetaceae bacterium]